MIPLANRALGAEGSHPRRTIEKSVGLDLTKCDTFHCLSCHGGYIVSIRSLFAIGNAELLALSRSGQSFGGWLLRQDGISVK